MRNDLARLQGAWAISEMEMDGQTISGGMIANARVAIAGGRFTSTGMGAVYEGTVILHDSAKPRQIDMIFDAGPEKGNTNLGIYALHGNTWKICLATRGGVRPSEFAVPPGSGYVVETLTRDESMMPVIEPATKNASVPDGNARATEFEGEWRMLSAIIDGQPLEKSGVQWVKRVTCGSETTVLAGPQTMMKMEFTFDASQSPKTIDYRNTAGSNAGKEQQGIYAFENGVLTICVSPPGVPRPAQFESFRGDGRTLTFWKCNPE